MKGGAWLPRSPALTLAVLAALPFALALRAARDGARRWLRALAP